MPTPEERRAQARARIGTWKPAPAAAAASQPSPPSPPSDEWRKVAEREGISAWEMALTALNALPAGIAGLVDPKSSIVENVTTPAFSQTGYADALQNRLRKGTLDVPSVGEVDLSPLSNLLLTDRVNKVAAARAAVGGQSQANVMNALNERNVLYPAARVGATVAEMLTPTGLGPLSKVARMIGSSAKAENAAAAVGRAILGPETGASAARSVASFVPRAFLPPAPIAEVSENAAVRAVAPEIRAGLEGAQRKLIAKYGAMSEEANRVLKEYGAADRPDVALAMTKAPLAAVEREIQPLQEAADISLDQSARDLIGKVSAGVIPADKLPPELHAAASDFITAHTRMAKTRERSASIVDELLKNAGYDLDALRKEAREAAIRVQSKLVRQEGATPVVTQGPASPRAAAGVVDGKPLDLTGGGKGAFDFQPEMFTDEIEKDLLRRRLDALYRAQAKADPAYTAQAEALERARQRFANETGRVMRDKDMTLTLANSKDAARFLSQLRKRKMLVDEIAALRAKGAQGMAELEAKLTPQDRDLIALMRGKLAERNKGLVERGILDPSKVDPTISGERYLPIIAKAAGKEAEDAWKQIVKRGHDAGEAPDDVARSLGYKDASEVQYLKDNSPKVELTTTIGRPTTVNVRARNVPIEEAVQSPKAYYENVVRPAFIGMARSEQAMLSHDTIKTVFDKAKSSGLAELVDTKAAGGTAALEAKAAARGMVPLSFGDDFAKQLQLTGEIPESSKILIHKDIADMLEAYLNPKAATAALGAVNDIQNAVVPLYTTLNLKFAPNNLVSGVMYNYMHLGEKGMLRAVQNAKPIGMLAAKLAENPFAALSDPANAAFFAKTLDTPTGKVSIGQIAQEMAEKGLVGQGIRGAEYVSRVGGDLVEQKSWAEKIPGVNVLPKAATITETHNRVQGYLGQRLMGATPEEAAERMLKWQVDYSKPLSPQAKGVRAFAPFFRWFQAQTPNMIQAVATQPDRARRVGMLPAEIERATTTKQERGDLRQLQQQYQRDAGYVPLKADNTVYNVNLRVPGSRDLAALDLLIKPVTAKLPADSAQNELLKTLSLLFLGPASSAFTAYFSGIDPYSGKETRGSQPVMPPVADLMQMAGADRSRSTGEYTLPGGVNYLLEASPAIKQTVAPVANVAHALRGESPIRTNVRRGQPTKPSEQPGADALANLLGMFLAINPQTLEEMKAAKKAEDVRRRTKLQKARK